MYLEGNGLSKIEGLSTLTQLRALYLQENVIESIEGLDALVELDTLNLNQNFIESLEGLQNCRKLSTLLVQTNRIKDASALAPLVHNPNLSVLDLSSNRLDDHEAVLSVLSQLPELRVLYLKGNPLVETTPSYRKTVLSRLPNLKYLDDRPVFEDERRTVTAWAQGKIIFTFTYIY